ncbi:MAG: hypothetical protein EA394_01165 [Bacteroidia bacterium]|nr:MAG: hypothetical protein EA394_01165 [Bacteroidia bacterium]
MKAVFVFFLAACLVAGAFKPLTAQVSIAPSTVFISDQTNIGTVYVSNRSDETQEVSIEFAFGYPSSDENGNIIMVYDDQEAFQKHAINEWVRAFPRSFVLGPRQQQTVRFQVRPQPQAEDGTYWTRVRILANPQTPDIDLAPDEDGIATRITFRFEQIIAAFYKKGNTTTGVNVTTVDARHEDDRLILLPHLQRTGNSPFVGSIVAKMYDTGGNLVAERQTTTTAYFDAVRRIELDTEGLEPGNYRVELSFETRRGDISPADLVQAPPVTEVIEVTIP